MKTRVMPFAMLLIIGCSAPRSAYDWGKHDQDLFTLMKDPGKLEAYGMTLRELIDRHPDGQRLPPGICAEYGYVLLAVGRPGEAQPYFEMEKRFWPEATRLMDRMIGTCRPKPAPAPEKTASTGSTSPKQEVL